MKRNGRTIDGYEEPEQLSLELLAPAANVARSVPEQLSLEEWMVLTLLRNKLPQPEVMSTQERVEAEIRALFRSFMGRQITLALFEEVRQTMEGYVAWCMQRRIEPELIPNAAELTHALILDGEVDEGVGIIDFMIDRVVHNYRR